MFRNSAISRSYRVEKLQVSALPIKFKYSSILARHLASIELSVWVWGVLVWDVWVLGEDV